jgi:serine/threonine protein kinase
MGLPSRIGRYEVELLLGQGGMGRVLLARDTVLGREVALKILRDDLGLPPELKAQLVDRMRQEARTAATLSHPAMVTLHDMGEDAEVGLYLVFERIAGPTLRERLVESGPLPPAEIAQLARGLGAALTHAHAAGVVHRDVKPENVMLSPTGPKLTDFGIARLPDSTLTQGVRGGGGGTVLGTPAYSAPEALAAGTFSASSDQFSLAATLYEALTGARAFPGDEALAVATRVASGKHRAVTAALPALRSFPHIDVIFDRALAKAPRNRFASCEVFGTALAAELEGANAAYLMTPVPRSSIVARATRRWQNTAVVGALAVITALIVGGRLQGSDDRVSLRGVANDFAAATGAPRPSAAAGSPAASHHGRVSPGANNASPPGGAAIPLPPGTPSGSETPGMEPPAMRDAAGESGRRTDLLATSPSGHAEPALDSAASDAGHPPRKVRTLDAVAPADASQP